MRAKGSGARWALFDHKLVMDLDNPDQVYLDRWRIVQTPWFGLLFHRIYQPDWARELHNHPWGFLSLILTGGYVEQVQRGGTDSPLQWFYRGPGTIARRTTKDFHRIHKLDGTVRTLILVGPRRQHWGFKEDGVYIDEAEYIGRKRAAKAAKDAKDREVNEAWDRYQSALAAFDVAQQVEQRGNTPAAFWCHVYDTDCPSPVECTDRCSLLEGYADLTNFLEAQ